MTSTERYKKDEAYRERCKARVVKNHLKNLQFPVYIQLHKIRVSIGNWKDSIKYHQRKKEMFQNRIWKAQRRKEELELQWGKIRAERKKNGNLLVRETEAPK